MDLTRPFSSYFGVGPYRLIVKFERGQKVVKDFEVYFDHEKSVAVLAKMLANDNDHGQRNWAISNLAQFDRPKFIILLEELVKSGSEKQRDFASRMLAQTSAGWFDPLKLKIESKDRYQPGEDLIVAISIMNGSSTPQTVKYAHDQKFFLELSDVVATGSTPRTKTCVYTPSEAAQKPKLVTLGETDETTLSLNLAECLGARLGAGKYQLIVKPEYDERMRDQTAVRSFEVR